MIPYERRQKEIELLADFMDDALRHYDDDAYLEKLHEEEKRFMEKY